MTRRAIFAGNWKMNTLMDEARELIQGLKEGLGDTGGREVVVFPPSIHVREVVSLCQGSPIDVGVQNIYHESSGAFTGEISPDMAKDSGCRYVLVGHSERRHVFGETDEATGKKVRAALDMGLEPMLCVGELLEEREENRTMEVIDRQVRAALEGCDASDMEKVVIAYEPVWAIGTGKVATPEIAQEVHASIRNLLADLYDSDLASGIPVLYGGSVKPDNISGLFSEEDIDGVLVGGASLKVRSFLDIIQV
jgi:triosephosphate isomerase